jgi:hypothetical protein
VFENGARKIFGPKRDEVMGGWRKLHNEELNYLYCLPSVIRMTKSLLTSQYASYKYFYRKYVKIQSWILNIQIRVQK